MQFLKRFRRDHLIGVVDARTARKIFGWARNACADTPVMIDFYVDGKLVGSAPADRFRGDLTSEAPHGRCAFEYTLPEDCCDDRDHVLEVRARGSRKPLTNGRFTLRLGSARFYNERLCDLLRSGLWVLAGSRENNTVHFGGWMISPQGENGRIIVNGQSAAVVTRTGSSDWKTPLPPQFALRTFNGTVALEGSSPELHFSFGQERAFQPLHDYYYPLFNVATPAPARIMRVAGHGSEFLFNLEGHSLAKKLDLLSQRFVGRRLAALGPVLDWGCGCGRVARFLAREGVDVNGVDIDRENARWCADHIEGRFAAITPEPPAPFADDFFAAIYGISVFTHLTPHYEALWLTELHRIARPGALLFLSVLGETAAAREGVLESVSLDHSGGLIDFGRNPGIDAVTQGSEYYRNVFHQPGYVARTWGEYFEILSIERGIIGNHQDLVIARKAQ